ncbi:armadillo-type protein [Syncephalis plumigaleata]|nr:armadillo-type protein [Syncephalis plumigaleata]
MTGEIYNLCKDQHGCRFLQRKLEEQKRKNVNLIFAEVSPHVVELMTDPFGNYLCQKLIEFCADEQRTAIVETVAPELRTISLNMHGTRAVQKMIEFLSSPQQIRVVVAALKPNVVTLIKDLNGNHVIQKCLHRLLSIDNQFIYDAVAEHCVEVSTHRHGCWYCNVVSIMLLIINEFNWLMRLRNMHTHLFRIHLATMLCSMCLI